MTNLQDKIFIFDVDSTLIREETLERIIEIAVKDSVEKDDVLKNIQKITNLGMEGKMDFRESLKKRLEAVNILQGHINLYNESIVAEIDFNFKKIIELINERDGEVFIISGGFIDNVGIVASELGVIKDNCFANNFIKKGDKIVGFDEDNPLSNSDGKVRIVEKIKKLSKNKKIICIGDGNSDYLIKKEGIANEFWGFWGNVKRRSIEKKADRNFYSSKELLEFTKSIVDKNILSVNRWSRTEN